MQSLNKHYLFLTWRSVNWWKWSKAYVKLFYSYISVASQTNKMLLKGGWVAATPKPLPGTPPWHPPPPPPPSLPSLRLRKRPQYAGEIWKRSLSSPARPGVRPSANKPHTSPSRNVAENGLQTGGIWKRRLFVFMRMENVSKTDIRENDGSMIIMWFPWAVSLHWNTNLN